MIKLKYPIILISVVIYSCTHQPITKSRNHIATCEYCDSIFQAGIFDYPYREIDKNVDAIPLIDNPDGIVAKDTFQALTDREASTIKNHLFCFLGMEDSIVFSYFYPNNQVIWEATDTKKSISYYYNRGNYLTHNGGQIFYLNEEREDAEFWLDGSWQFFLTFKKINNEYLYAGTQQDSLRWLECVKEKR